MFESENTGAPVFLRALVFWALRRVGFPDFAVDDGCAVDPGVIVFSEEAVASHDVPFEKAVLADRLQHVT